MEKIIFILLSFLCLNVSVNASSEIKWHTMDELIEKSNNIDKTILVLIQTGENEDASSLKVLENKAISQYIKANYYTVKFNIHDRKSYTIKNCTYHFLPHKNYHYLAHDWTYGDMSTDALMFLNGKMDLIYGVHGEQNVDELLNTLQYFNGPHLMVSWDDFDAGMGQKLTDNIPMILRDYKNSFVNIKGDLALLKRFSKHSYQYEYKSMVTIPNALKTSIIYEVKYGKKRQYFKALLADNLTYAEGKKALAEWSNDLSLCDIKNTLEASSLNQNTVNSGQEISTIFVPFELPLENKKIAISLDLVLPEGQTTYSLILVVKKNRHLFN